MVRCPVWTVAESSLRRLRTKTGVEPGHILLERGSEGVKDSYTSPKHHKIPQENDPFREYTVNACLL